MPPAPSIRPPGQRLREIHGARGGGEGRRWFACAQADLYVWQGTDGAITGFELCYGKPRDERVLRWNLEGGWSHARIDDGEAGPWVNATPIAVADGLADPELIALELERLGAELEPRIYRFVLGKLWSLQ